MTSYCRHFVRCFRFLEVYDISSNFGKRNNYFFIISQDHNYIAGLFMTDFTCVFFAVTFVSLYSNFNANERFYCLPLFATLRNCTCIGPFSTEL